jgi:GTP 3',8-cyclase
VAAVIRPSRQVEQQIDRRIEDAHPDTWDRSGTEDEPLAPLLVEIQPTALCHRTCSFCSHIIRNRRSGALSEEDVRGLLDQLKRMGVPRIAFSGGGEPLYWAEGDTVAAIRYAAGFADVSLTTSGDQLLDAETGELHPSATDVVAHCSAIYLNIPAVNELSFAKQVRGPSGWKHTSAMMRQLLALRDSDPERFRCQVVAVVVLSAFNVAQVPVIDRVLVDHGLDAIYYKQWKDFEKRNVRKVKLADEQLLAGLEQLPAEVRSRDLTAFMASLRTPALANHPCWTNRLSFDAIVDPDGEVYVCTPTVGKPEHSVGNLDDGPFAQLWAGSRRRERLRVLDGMSLAGVCPSECRHHPDNAAIDADVDARVLAARDAN